MVGVAGIAGATVALAAVAVLLGALLRWSGLPDAAHYTQLAAIPLALVPAALWLWFHRTPAPAAAPETVPLPALPRLLDLTALTPIRTTDPRALGVRQAIEDLPPFVPRPVVTELRRVLLAGARTGGLAVLVGDPSVGKTRALHEAVAEELPDFAVLAPDPGDGAAIDALAYRTDELPPLVVWLDQLHRFLDGPYALDGDTPIDPTCIRRLLAADTPVLVVGTLWPEHLRALRAAGDELLDDPRCTTLPVASFTAEERAAAERLRDTDPRLAEALTHPAYGVTEALAGVPAMMRCYAEASDGLRALVHAAVDARRLGVYAPLTATCLRETGRAHLRAARGDLRAARGDDRWFTEALDQLGQSAVFVPVRGSSGALAHTLADHLAHHLLRARRREPVPEQVWTVLASETTDEADLARLADAATHRHIHRIAVPLWCRLVAAGRPGAADRLVDVFAQWGDVRALKEIEPPFDRQAAQALARLAARHAPDEDEDQAGLPGMSVFAVDTPLIDVTAGRTLWRLTDLLDENGHHRELAAHAAAGDHHAAMLLARSAAATVDDAVALLTPGVVMGDHESVRALASIRYEQEDFRAAAELVRPYAEAGEGWATHLLRAIKVAARDVDWLTAAAAAGDVRAGRAVVRICYLDRDIQALARHALDDEFGALLLNRMWFERGDLAALRTRAATGDRYAAWLLATALVERDDVDGLVELVAEQVPVVPGMLAGLLFERVDVATLEGLTDPACTLALALLRAGHCADPDELLTMVPRVFDQVPALFDARSMWSLTTELRRRFTETAPDNDKELLLARASAEAGPSFQHPVLTSLLTHENDIASLTWLVSIGRGWAAPPLAGLHLRRGDVDAAIAVLTAAAEDGNAQAAASLADTLYQHDRDTELRARADAGDHHAAARVATLLRVTEETEELVDRAAAGDGYALDAVLEHLSAPADRGTAIELLSPWVAAGSAGAAHRLSVLHERDGDLEEAARVLQPLADHGDPTAAHRITELTYAQGNLATLRTLADAGDRDAARRIAATLFDHRDTTALAREVAAGNTDDAARHLIALYRTTARHDTIHSLDPTGAPDPGDWHPAVP